MSENRTECLQFEDLLLEGGPEADLGIWQPHLETCAGCREQLIAHQMLAATFADEAVPEPSASFAAGLQRKIDAAVEIKPLEGWRMAAMIGYALLAAGLLRWIFARFPLPAISIDPASPWALAFAMLAVPLTLWLAVRLTRWLPPMGRRNTPHLSLL